MTISRGQMPRQMYGLGSFVKKAVKGVTKGIKSIAKSDLGKLALGAGAIYGLGGGFKGALPFLRETGGFSPSNIFTNLGGLMGLKPGKDALLGNVAKVGLAGTVLGGALADYGGEEDTTIGGERNVEALRAKLTQAYRNLRYPEDQIPGLVENDLAEYTMGAGGYAEGGRIGFEDGTPKSLLDMIKIEASGSKSGKQQISGAPEGFTIDKETFNAILKADIPLSQKIDFLASYQYGKGRDRIEKDNQELFLGEGRFKDRNIGLGFNKDGEGFGGTLMYNMETGKPEFKGTFKKSFAEGGRLGYAFGNQPEQNAIRASGIMDLPLNQNPAGVTELDLRDSGGFIPPVGVKEKADDIPAMLSNNEFVFTADAVKGLGDGDVNKGAQRMYDMMKKLENGGRV